ncbi:MAG: nicotinamide-nucleotide amidohydrolase family protein [Natrialbaceae archaeon]|nr:nicotinamide-nucleotide amidohydrolase family protein [Natrialbaceae archaeon]
MTPPASVDRLGDQLTEREETVAVAESCTGGLLGGEITAVPGASAYFETGIVTYANSAKQRELGVSREALDAHGAVSEAVALEMARGVRDVTASTWGLATTGIAGPSGGTAETPVGTVYIGVAYAAPWGSEDSSASATRYAFDGDRQTIRQRTVTAAIGALLEAIDETAKT